MIPLLLGVLMATATITTQLGQRLLLLLEPMLSSSLSAAPSASVRASTEGDGLVLVLAPPAATAATAAAEPSLGRATRSLMAMCDAIEGCASHLEAFFATHCAAADGGSGGGGGDGGGDGAAEATAAAKAAAEAATRPAALLALLGCTVWPGLARHVCEACAALAAPDAAAGVAGREQVTQRNYASLHCMHAGRSPHGSASCAHPHPRPRPHPNPHPDPNPNPNPNPHPSRSRRSQHASRCSRSAWRTAGSPRARRDCATSRRSCMRTPRRCRLTLHPLHAFTALHRLTSP